MIPWLLFWAPQLHFPFGGDVAQRIAPNTNWFFDAILPTAGNASVERRAFEIASYGRQLGWITEALLGIAGNAAPATKQGSQALDNLRRLKEEIDGLKVADADSLVRQVEMLVEQLQTNHKGEYLNLRKRIEAKLAEPRAVVTLPAPSN